MFTDTLYYLTISPDGMRNIFTTGTRAEPEMSQKVYSVDKKAEIWGEPKEVKALSNLGAGYFQIMKNNKVYFFAQQPREGIYFTQPNDTGEYVTPMWLSDKVSLENSSTFDILMHEDEYKLLVSHYYVVEQYLNRG